MQNSYLETLKQVQSSLLKMHRLLMASQKSHLEARTGRTISPAEWMQVMITEQEFAWLKAMLTLISDIDALMDNYTVSERELQIVRQATEILFLKGDGSNQDFYSNYRQIVQNDPDAMLFHGQLRNQIQSLPLGENLGETTEIRRNWHTKPKNFH